MANSEIIRIAAATPQIKVANISYNSNEIIRMLRAANEARCGIIVFPELTLTGCTAGDLFRQGLMHDSQLDALQSIAAATSGLDIAVVLGFYLEVSDKLYNCAAVIQSGKVRGIVPKIFTANDESRWFSSGAAIPSEQDCVVLFGEEIPFGNIVFRDEAAGLTFAVEVGESLQLSAAPSSALLQNGAVLILNPTACIAAAGANKYRRELISTHSRKTLCGYISTSAGAGESTTDMVYSAHQIIASAGELLAENSDLTRKSPVTIAEIDYGKLKFQRMQEQNAFFPATPEFFAPTVGEVSLSPLRLFDFTRDRFTKAYRKNPFIPDSKEELHEVCSEIFRIQASALAKRMAHVGSKKSILGVSGGLDSTLALLVMVEAHRLLNLPRENLITVTLPGFGTTDTTHSNAVRMMELLGTDFREISIVQSVKKHFADIGHDEYLHDLTYENAQARERTQILMDIAGKEGALLVGTGDLSELALGWCTYNGDHMAMYGVNGGIPKTQMQSMVRWVAEEKLSTDPNFCSDNAALRETLCSILDTPISPELLPTNASGDLVQKTEESVGPYILHDFFLYHTLRSGMPPEKLLLTASRVFEGEYDIAFILKCLKIFYGRFFSQQFKRSCMPDGPIVGEISLSPRGALAMPSDAESSVWMEELSRLEVIYK